VDLSVLQLERNRWVRANFPDDSMEDSILGATEEVGELAHHYLKYKQGIRGDATEHIAGMLDSVADCVIFLAGVATHLGVDYGLLVDETWNKVKQRDWAGHPTDGGEVS
jgi:NTP pyrophosphatase (non-canonical NTP hydrolase)